MTQSRSNGRWLAVPAIGGSLAALLILSSCGREAPSPVAPELAVLSPSVQSGKDNDKDKKVTLRVELDGKGNGMVKSEPKGIACGGTAKHGDDDEHGKKGKDNDHGDKGKDDEHGENCRESFAKDAVVTLTAEAIGRSVFTGWSGACSGTNPTCTLTLNESKEVTAKFSKGVTSYTLTVATTVTGNGTGTGSVTSTVGGISCGATCTASFAAGTLVSLEAAPVSGSSFVSWSGSCSGTTATCLLTMDAVKNATATFRSNTVTVMTVFATTSSGSVTSAPSGINCVTGSCVASFGSSVVLTAIPNAATSQFKEWAGDCAGTIGQVCVLSVDAAKSVTANFELLSAPPTTTYPLTVTIVGVGSVTSDPFALDCVTEDPITFACPAEPFTSGSQVIIMASGTVTWSGCDEVDINNNCILTMTGPKAVTATFGPTATVARSGSGPSPLRGTGSASVTSDQPRTLSAFIEQQR